MVEVFLSPGAERDLKKMPPRERQRALKSCLDLRSDPLPLGKRVKQLRGFDPPLYRLRIGDYRAIYRVAEDGVVVLAVIHRSELAEALRTLR